MNRRFNNTHSEEPEPKPVSETGPDSPSSGDDPKIEEPSPKKRKGMQKRVVSIPIVDVEASKSKGETYPPSDSWAWRKYGQKPIKGSPYPRGYYRCSSSKGCPARKQVERSRVDPTMLIVTYAYDHNHSPPTRKSSAAATSYPKGAATTSIVDLEPAPPEEVTVFTSHNDLELTGDSTVLLSQHYAGFRWFDDVASTNMLESSICDEVDNVALTMREEDESLFADLDELPECSTVFRRRNILSSSAIQCNGMTR